MTFDPLSAGLLALSGLFGVVTVLAALTVRAERRARAAHPAGRDR